MNYNREPCRLDTQQQATSSLNAYITYYYKALDDLGFCGLVDAAGSNLDSSSCIISLSLTNYVSAKLLLLRQRLIITCMSTSAD